LGVCLCFLELAHSGFLQLGLVPAHVLEQFFEKDYRGREQQHNLQQTIQNKIKWNEIEKLYGKKILGILHNTVKLITNIAMIMEVK
jgi:hypothetical protein